MNAFFIAQVRVRNPEKYAEYAQKAGATIKSHGGELQQKGKFSAALAGEGDHELAALVAFPDIAALKGWFRSEAYQALIPLRDEAADVRILAYG